MSGARDETDGLDRLLALEHQVWAALMTGDRAADERLLSDDFLGVYGSGQASKAEHVSQLNGGAVLASYQLSEARVLSLGEGLALLSYRADWRRTAPPDAGEPDPLSAMYISSIWRREPDGVWRNVFSQDTPCVVP